MSRGKVRVGRGEVRWLDQRSEKRVILIVEVKPSRAADKHHRRGLRQRIGVRWQHDPADGHRGRGGEAASSGGGGRRQAARLGSGQQLGVGQQRSGERRRDGRRGCGGRDHCGRSGERDPLLSVSGEKEFLRIRDDAGRPGAEARAGERDRQLPQASPERTGGAARVRGEGEGAPDGGDGGFSDRISGSTEQPQYRAPDDALLRGRISGGLRGGITAQQFDKQRADHVGGGW